MEVQIRNQIGDALRLKDQRMETVSVASQCSCSDPHEEASFPGSSWRHCSSHSTMHPIQGQRRSGTQKSQEEGC